VDVPLTVPGEATPIPGVGHLVVQLVAVVVKPSEGKQVANAERAIPEPDRSLLNGFEEHEDFAILDEFAEL